MCLDRKTVGLKAEENRRKATRKQKPTTQVLSTTQKKSSKPRPARFRWGLNSRLQHRVNGEVCGAWLCDGVLPVLLEGRDVLRRVLLDAVVLLRVLLSELLEVVVHLLGPGKARRAGVC